MTATTSTGLIQKSIERAIGQLPALPDAVLKVVDETNRAEPNSARVESLISSDPTLTSKTLKVVNSAYYGLPGQVASVGQAIVILGLTQVRNLVLSVGTMSLFEGANRSPQDLLKQFWLHSFTTAAVCQALGVRLRVKQETGELMFVGGLLHDIGRLFLYTSLSTVYDQVLKRAETQQMPLVMAEREILGMDHGAVGAMLCTAWKLPETLVQIIQHHEGPFDGSESAETYAVHVADGLDKLAEASEAEVATIIDPLSLQKLRLSESAVEELKQIAEKKREDACSLYGTLAS